jgi:hypothetical protein
MKPYAILLPLIFFLTMPAGAADPMYEVNQLLQKGKTEQALEKIDAFLSSQPKDAWGRNITQMRFLKGRLLAEQKRNVEAIQVFAKLTQDYPDLPEPYNNLAVLYAAQGRTEDAREALERALRTDPSYATAYRNLNEIYARLASQAYDHTLQVSNGSKPAPALIKELCDNYGRMAKQSIGRQQAGDGEINLIRDIPKSRSNAGAPPSKVYIDEMAMADATAEPPLPPAFTNPAVNPAPQVPSVIVKAKPNATSKVDDTIQKKIAAIPQPLPPGEEKAVLATVQSWAGAWSGKNIGAYLAFYAKDFRAPNGQSRGEWEKLRRERIGKPKSIKVTVDAPKVALNDATHAVVSFRQGYRSDNLQTNTRKTLLMIKSGGKWLIQDEQVGN